jgi:exocyst complex component 3
MTVQHDFELEACLAARHLLSDLLRHPDDLTNKFRLLKKKFNTERQSIDAQLKTGATAQYEEASRGLNALAQAQVETVKVKQNLVCIC